MCCHFAKLSFCPYGIKMATWQDNIINDYNYHIKYMENEIFGDIELREDDWDRSYKSQCDPCYPGIDNLGTFQCRNCLADLVVSKAVIRCLKEDHGESWKDEYKILKETQKLVRMNKFDQLRRIYVTYRDNNGNIKTDRYFYEKIRRY